MSRACDLCGEHLPEPHDADFLDHLAARPGDAPAEVVDTQTGEHLLVHSEPCSYEHGERYVLA